MCHATTAVLDTHLVLWRSWQEVGCRLLRCGCLLRWRHRPVVLTNLVTAQVYKSKACLAASCARAAAGQNT